MTSTLRRRLELPGDLDVEVVLGGPVIASGHLVLARHLAERFAERAPTTGVTCHIEG